MLVAAARDTRMSEGRFTGGFEYSPLRPPSRSTDRSEEVYSLLAAAGETQRAVENDPSLENRHVHGVALALLGRYDDAIRELEVTVGEEVGNDRYQSDLAAAYIARASQGSRADDWVQALAATERALRRNGSLAEAHFNRGLALVALKMPEQARVAWTEYLKVDGASQWADEARRQLHDVENSVLRNQKAYATAFEEAVTYTQLMDLQRARPAEARAFLEEALPLRWAETVLSGAPAPAGVLSQASRAASGFAHLTHDRFALDTIEWLRTRSAGAQKPAARDVREFLAIVALAREDRILEIEPRAATVLPRLNASKSPLRFPATYYTIFALSQRGDTESSIGALNELDASLAALPYPMLRGTIANRIGQIRGRQGDQERAIKDRLRAIAWFEQAGNEEQVAVMHTMISESHRLLGDLSSAWTHHRAALNRIDQIEDYRAKHLVISGMGLTATRAGLFESAVHLQTATIANGVAWQRASGIATGYLQRARNYSRLGDDFVSLASADVSSARKWVNQIPDAAFRERIELELLEVEGELYSSTAPERALPALDRAVARFESTGFGVRTARLLLTRGRLHLAQGHAQLAAEDWRQGIERLTAEREHLTAEQLRMSQAGAIADLHLELAMNGNGPPDSGSSALDAVFEVEQSRSRGVVEALVKHRPMPSIGDIQTALAPGVTLAYFAVSARESRAWLLTRAKAQSVDLGLSQAQVSRLVRRYRQTVDGHGRRDAFFAMSQQLYDALIAPLAPFMSSATTMIVIPDPELNGISFGSLRNPRSKRLLIEEVVLAVAPSATALMGDARFNPGGRVVAIGVSPEATSGFAPLPMAEEEARLVASVYQSSEILTGLSISKKAVLSAMSGAAVVHFAGHAVVTPQTPLLSRFVLGRKDESSLFAYEIAEGASLPGSLVVLAACSSGFAGMGSIDDGVLALARPFIARGASAVLATLWDVSDTAATDFVRGFHADVARGIPPITAWRNALISGPPEEADERAAFILVAGTGTFEAARAAETDGAAGK